VSSAGQHAIGVIRWKPPFIGVSSSWAHNTSRRSLASQSHSPNASHHCSSNHNNHLFFFPQPQATPASHQLHTSHSGVGIQTLVRVGDNESKEGARGGRRTRHTNRFSRQTHLNTPTIRDDEMKPHEALKLSIRVVQKWTEASWRFICSTAPSSGQ